MMSTNSFPSVSNSCRAVIRQQLFPLQDKKYQSFHSGLIPNIPSESIIGIRMPQLRKLAKHLAKDKLLDSSATPLHWQDFFSEIETAFHQTATETAPLYYEETLLAGLALSYAKLSLDARLLWIKRFVPMIDNWAVCDTFCGTWKPAEAQLPAVFRFVSENYLPPQAKTTAEYSLRYGIVMLLTHFVSREAYIDRVLTLCNGICHPAYYVKMAVAWTLSYAFIHFPERTIRYFRSPDNCLDDFTYNKSIQKARESYRVPEETKALLQSMRH